MPSSAFFTLGRDHWSLLAYVEIRVIDYQVAPGVGVIDREHLRRDPTNHDDWDRLHDLQKEGFLNIESSDGCFVRLTCRGIEAVSKLRTHKASGGTFSTFRWGLNLSLSKDTDTTGYRKPTRDLNHIYPNFDVLNVCNLVVNPL
jgi:hypothetical protein